jgi:hypothetical protein
VPVETQDGTRTWDECEGSIPMHSVDYLFLTEQPCVANNHTTETLLSSIETLVPPSIGMLKFNTGSFSMLPGPTKG